MLYTWENAAGAQVVDLERNEKIKNVLKVNTRAGWVMVGYEPVRLDAQGKVMGERIRFDSIYPIFGNESRPVAFHCIGRHE